MTMGRGRDRHAPKMLAVTDRRNCLKKLTDNQIAFFKSQDGSVNIGVMYAENEADQVETSNAFLQVTNLS